MSETIKARPDSYHEAPGVFALLTGSRVAIEIVETSSLPTLATSGVVRSVEYLSDQKADVIMRGDDWSLYFDCVESGLKVHSIAPFAATITSPEGLEINLTVQDEVKVPCD